MRKSGFFAVNYDRENNQVIQERAHMLEDVRVEAESRIVLTVDLAQVASISGQSDLVLLPAAVRREQFRILDRFERDTLLPGLKRSALVFAGTAIDLDSDPEDGRVKELVMIHDELEHAKKTAAAAKQKAMREQAKLAAVRKKAADEGLVQDSPESDSQS